MSRDREVAVTRSIALIQAQEQMLAGFLQQQVVDHPPARRVLMVGPHPDDNLLGAGGVALRYVAAGIPVSWICLTDGRACVSDPEERERMARLRPREEQECGRQLGAREVVALGLPEDRLTRPEVHRQAVEGLREALARIRPDAVFVPWAFDTHPLHRYTAHLVAEALRDHAEDCQVYSWCLGSIAPPSMLVDITEVFERKCALMDAHASQQGMHDYIGQIRALSAVLGGLGLDRIERAELYVPRSRQEYVEETLALALDDPRTLAAGPQPMLDPLPAQHESPTEPSPDDPPR